VGAKQAMKILGGISVRHLAEALDNGNLKLLSSIPGIGPKTAQKMILALRNVLVLDDDTQRESKERGVQKNSVWADIVNALVDMGYERRRVEETIQALSQDMEETLKKVSHHDAEELLFRSAIKMLG
ncbi:MAG: Holliday junction branch migration protein RuvA, partial [Sphaerochaeta sp.]|nr:Holliday junction branch migration protein RuvA [Sphaerochaeta sp.]